MVDPLTHSLKKIFYFFFECVSLLKQLFYLCCRNNEGNQQNTALFQIKIDIFRITKVYDGRNINTHEPSLLQHLGGTWTNMNQVYCSSWEENKQTRTKFTAAPGRNINKHEPSLLQHLGGTWTNEPSLLQLLGGTWTNMNQVYCSSWEEHKQTWTKFTAAPGRIINKHEPSLLLKFGDGDGQNLCRVKK